MDVPHIKPGKRKTQIEIITMLSREKLPTLVSKFGSMPSATQPIRPKPPAWASIIDVPTGVPGNKPNSSAAFLDNPLPKEAKVL